MTTQSDVMENRFMLYLRLVRLDKPIGSLLLLWPTLCALWIASDGKPDWYLVLVFVLGTVLMRSAGCAINDFADRDFDRHVKRTADRPLTSGKLRPLEAVWVACSLAFLSFLLVLSLNWLTVGLSVIALVVAATYPLFKRFFALHRLISVSPSGSAFRWRLQRYKIMCPGSHGFCYWLISSGRWHTILNTLWWTVTTI